VASASREVENDLSLEISLVLLAVYAAHLVFSLITHRSFFRGLPSSTEAEVPETHQPWSRGRSLLVLAGATALIAWMSEVLVGSVEQAAHAWGMSQVFVGVIVVAVIGNAAEHSSAIVMAWKNRMDLSLAIAVGSSIQVALFVAPLLVLLSYGIGPAPMNLVFTPAEVLAVVVTAVIAAQIASDGESNWMEGAMLLAVYLILAMAFYFL
jgi:Ca2+:H+ antiporter